MAKYVKKPVVIEAIRWTGNNIEELEEFALNDIDQFSFEAHSVNIRTGKDASGAPLEIQTLEGVMTVSDGDYIIKGVNGEFYPCKPDIFKKTYEPYNE